MLEGIDPSNWLSNRYRSLSLCNLAISHEIVPERLEEANLIYLSFEQSPISGGKEFVKLLPYPVVRSWIFARLPRVEGTVPERLLAYKWRTDRFDNFLSSRRIRPEILFVLRSSKVRKLQLRKVDSMMQMKMLWERLRRWRQVQFPNLGGICLLNLSLSFPIIEGRRPDRF